MLNAIKREANITYTENGAVTYRSTMSDCLDFFSTAGALRNAEGEEIVKRFLRAYGENPDMAMKILFFTRDVREGLGERRVFRTILRAMGNLHPESVKKNIPFIAEYGRYDDLLCLLDTACREETVAFIKEGLEADCRNLAQGKPVSLLAKWLPSVNATNRETVRTAVTLAKLLGMKPAEYRKTLSVLRKAENLLENNLREKDYSFDYSKQPSNALFKYRAAFLRNDASRYWDFLDKVSRGEAVLHADNLMPYELVRKCLRTDIDQPFNEDLSPEEKTVLNTTWDALPDFGNGENALAVVDASGSMYLDYREYQVIPATVAFSLGIYFAERNKGQFHNHFMTFSSSPQLLQLKGENFVEKVEYLSTFDKVADTNLEAVFRVLLEAAVKNRIPQEELPSTLYIISDMEFNECTQDSDATNFHNAQEMFRAAGYRLPKVVFWNVASRWQQQPVTQNEQGAVLVSGCNPRLFSQVISGEVNPEKFMREILGSARYAAITA